MNTYSLQDEVHAEVHRQEARLLRTDSRSVAKTKNFTKLFKPVPMGPGWVFEPKRRGRKSHYTVPFSCILAVNWNFFHYVGCWALPWYPGPTLSGCVWMKHLALPGIYYSSNHPARRSMVTRETVPIQVQNLQCFERCSIFFMNVSCGESFSQ